MSKLNFNSKKELKTCFKLIIFRKIEIFFAKSWRTTFKITLWKAMNTMQSLKKYYVRNAMNSMGIQPLTIYARNASSKNEWFLKTHCAKRVQSTKGW